MNKDVKTLWKLFCSTFYLSAFTFGGGYVIVPLMKKKFVNDLKWIDEEEMMDLIAIAQSSPGAIAVNSSMIIGYRIAGLSGALIAMLGTVMPPLIIISIISTFYVAFRDNAVVSAVLKGMQSGVAAVIIDVVINLIFSVVKGKQLISILTMLGAFLATFVFKVNVMWIILVCGVIGVVSTIYKEKFRKERN